MFTISQKSLVNPHGVHKFSLVKLPFREHLNNHEWKTFSDFVSSAHNKTNRREKKVAMQIEKKPSKRCTKCELALEVK